MYCWLLYLKWPSQTCIYFFKNCLTFATRAHPKKLTFALSNLFEYLSEVCKYCAKLSMLKINFLNCLTPAGDTNSSNHNHAIPWAALIPDDASTAVVVTAEGQVGTVEPGLIGSFVDQSAGKVCWRVRPDAANDHDLSGTCSHHTVPLDRVGQIR